MRQATVAYDHDMNPRLDRLASIGVLALATDASIEKDWRTVLSMSGVGFYVGRVENETEVSVDNLRAIESRIGAGLDALLPHSRLDCIAFACTSAALFIGEAQVDQLVRAARPGVEVTNPLTAAKAALAALGSRRIAMLTPYVDAVNVPMAEALEDSGVEVAVMGSFFNSSDPEVVRIDESSIRRAALDLASRVPVDAVFIACTALGASHLVPSLEDAIGQPVTTSNHAMAWHALRLCGVDERFAGRGRLFTLAPNAVDLPSPSEPCRPRSVNSA